MAGWPLKAGSIASLAALLIAVVSLLLLDGRRPFGSRVDQIPAGQDITAARRGAHDRRADEAETAAETAAKAEAGAAASVQSGRHSGALAAPPPEPAFEALAGWPGVAEAERRFGAEARDTEWAAVTEGRLLSLISQLDRLGLNRLEADCRESICRLLLLHPPDVEPIYSVRQIYDRAGELGLGPVLAETQVEDGEPDKLLVFLRRRAPTASRR